MRKFLCAAALAVMPALALAEPPAPKGRKLITIDGGISETNLGSFGAGTASIMRYPDIWFDAVAEFDQAVFDALPTIAF